MSQWLNQNLEEQSMELNQHMSSQALVSPAQLQTLYRAGYASMIISGHDIPNTSTGNVYRPDLTRFALLWLAEVGTAPNRWNEKWVQKRLISEAKSLKEEGGQLAAGFGRRSTDIGSERMAILGM